jgi:plasmid stability protein
MTEWIDMCPTCDHVFHMSKMIQLRHVPDDLHRKLKARAAMEGLSLSDYLLQEVRELLEKPTLREMRERLAKRAPVNPRMPPAKAVRAEREGR